MTQNSCSVSMNTNMFFIDVKISYKFEFWNAAELERLVFVFGELVVNVFDELTNNNFIRIIFKNLFILVQLN